MIIKLIILLFPVIILGAEINLNEIEHGKRKGYYRLWVYFKDKNGAHLSNISSKAIARREKNGVLSPVYDLDLGISKDYIEGVSSIGVIIKNESRWLNAISVICSKSDVEKINKLSFVKKIKPVYGYKKSEIYDSIKRFNSVRDIDYGNSYEQLEQINVIPLHNSGYTGAGITVLYIDTGFDLSHNAMNNVNVINQWDFINNDENTSDENEEEISLNQDSHGTQVLSIMAAFKSGEMIGPAYEADYLLAKTEDVSQEIQLEEDNYVAALEWGESLGADIKVASLGYLDWYSYCNLDGNTAVTTIAVDIASFLGVLCVTSAGNEGSIPPEYPCIPPISHYVTAPADADSVISVGAVSSSGILRNTSSRGPTYDGRIKPEVCAQGSLTWAVSSTNNENYVRVSGTSASAPLVGGAAALIMQSRPTWTAMQVREAIIMTASMSDSINNNYGYGIMNAVAAANYETMEIKDNAINPSLYCIFNTYPNPFNPSLKIELILNIIERVSVDIFSLDGVHIRKIYDKIPDSKKLNILWTPNNAPSGVYFIRLVQGEIASYKKVSYIK